MERPEDRDFVPLRDVVARGEPIVPLEEAALHLARQEYPDLQPQPWLQRLDYFATHARSLLSPEPDPAEIVGVVNDVLFDTLGFRGNTDDYYDPRNTFLNDVIDRRLGIPISLAVVYIAVARRLGLEVHGTCFPGHFLLRVERPGWPIVIDAFHGGEILSQEDCCDLLEEMGMPKWQMTFLDPVSSGAILRRMLNNLKLIYAKRHDWSRLYRTLQQLRVLGDEL